MCRAVARRRLKPVLAHSRGGEMKMGDAGAICDLSHHSLLMCMTASSVSSTLRLRTNLIEAESGLHSPVQIGQLCKCYIFE